MRSSSLLRSRTAALAALALCLATTAGSLSASAALPGLAGAYGLSEGTGTVATDSSGTANNGVIAGPVWTSSGKYGSALTFDGSNDWVTIADAPSLDLTTGLTLEAWVRPTTSSGWRTVMLKEHGKTLAYALYSSAGGSPMGIVLTSGTQRKLSGPSALPSNTWSHLALTYDGTTMRLYVDGVQRATKAQTGAMPASTGPLRLGGNNVWKSEFLSGGLDEVRVYNRALSAAEIQADMNAPVAPTDTQPPSPPGNLRQTAASPTSATVAWDPSTDDVGVHGYEVFRSTTSLGTTTATSWNVTGLPCGSTIPVGVEALDTSMNRSTRSTVNVTTAACDTTPPSVSISAPAPGSTVSGVVPVTVSASDPSGVGGVQLYVNGAALGGEDQAAPYQAGWDTRLGPNGSRSLTAVARDSFGNVATSAPVEVTVDNDLTPPSVQVTAPGDGATVSGTVTLAASASDNRGVTGVRFRVDGTDLQPEDTTAPFTLDWNSASVTSGSHSLSAIARDAAGNTTTSATRTIFVQNGLNTGDAWEKVTVGPGYVDGSTRTPVRTAGGWVYLFAADDTARGEGDGPVVIRAWKANQPGIPTAFSEQDGANRPTAALGSLHVLTSPDVRLDASGIAHLVYFNESTDSLVYRTFSTLTDRWGPIEVVEADVDLDFDGNNQYRREATNSVIVDRDEVPHVIYKSGSSLVHRQKVGGAWSAPFVIDTPPVGTPRHSSAAADAQGNLHVTWLRSDWTVEDDPHPQIMYRRRDAQGVWGPLEVAAEVDVQTNENSDQGPSIVVTQNGVPHVLYVSDLPDSAVRTAHRTSGTWVTNHPPIDVFTHAPQIYSQFNDIYVFLGHDRAIHFGYLYDLHGEPWEPYERLDDTGDNDGSASPRWDPLHETNSDVIDVTFYEENLDNNSERLPELYYMAVLPSGGPTDSDPPSVPQGLLQTGATETSVSLSWTPSTDDTGVTAYGLYRNGTPAGSSPVASATMSGLACGTQYTVGVDAADAAGNRSAQASITASTSPCDTVAPTVSVTSPSAGASVAGITQLAADAFDNTGVAGVTFRVDGTLVGTEDTSTPYALDWNTSTYPNGPHTITATARDVSGNSTQSSPVSVTVANTGPTFPPSLVAAYPFAETSGTTTADVTGNGNTGTLSGPTRTAAGRHGAALTFDGTNDWVTVADAPELDLTTGLTLETWVRPTQGGGWRTLLLKENGSTLAYGLYSSASGGTPMAIVYTGGSQQKLSGPSALPVNTWTHLAATYDGTQLRLYVNGVQRAIKAVTGSIPNASGVLRMGGNNVWRSEWFRGDLDEVRVYNRALSQAEIEADMTTPLSG
ncbi:MAG TPA: LamG-like jellyroll fold domain-containing protein [Gaiellaceae bacterium]